MIILTFGVASLGHFLFYIGDGSHSTLRVHHWF